MAAGDPNKAAEGSGVASWRLPRLDADPSGAAVAATTGPAPTPPAALLQQWRAEALAAGHAEGVAQGRSEGHALGLEQGRAQAADELAAQLASMRSTLASLTDALETARYTADSVLSDAIAGLAAQLARTVLGAELTLSTDALSGVLAAALDAVREAQGPVLVRASSAVLAQMKDMGCPAGLQLEVDPMLNDGCRVLEPEHVQDFVVSDRFSRLLEDALGLQGIAPPLIRPQRDTGGEPEPEPTP